MIVKQIPVEDPLPHSSRWQCLHECPGCPLDSALPCPCRIWTPSLPCAAIDPAVQTASACPVILHRAADLLPYKHQLEPKPILPSAVRVVRPQGVTAWHGVVLQQKRPFRLRERFRQPRHPPKLLAQDRQHGVPVAAVACVRPVLRKAAFKLMGPVPELQSLECGLCAAEFPEPPRGAGRLEEQPVRAEVVEVAQEARPAQLVTRLLSVWVVEANDSMSFERNWPRLRRRKATSAAGAAFHCKVGAKARRLV
mmetsp:Transcript_35768/g.102812  ORF Transcript_35768/g.102812 Transcript_35768/m.102812 type:complete len:252 (-) Transcript_35768:25-780(-)